MLIECASCEGDAMLIEDTGRACSGLAERETPLLADALPALTLSVSEDGADRFAA